MFCPKCGNQIPEGAAFCANCGNRLGDNAANNPGYRATYSTGPSPIMKSLVTKLVGFFTTNRQEAVVMDAAKDTTWSGAIAAGICAVVFLLTQLVNFGAITRTVAYLAGVGYSRAWDIKYSIGIPFLWSLLFALLFAGALAGMTFVCARMCKVKIPFVCAVNVAAYASLALAAANIAGLLLGLIWAPLAIMCFVFGLIMTFALIYQALIKAYDMRNSALPFAVFVVAVLFLVAVASMVICGAVLG